MKKLYIAVFQSSDGRACSQPVIATCILEAEKLARENEALDYLEFDECYALDIVDGYKINITL